MQLDEKDKNSKETGKEIKKKRRLRALETSENKFVIEIVNGIEIAYANRAQEDIVTEKSIKNIENLSKIAIDQFNREGRGGFLLIFEVNPNEGAYLTSEKLFECIKQMIPDALDYVRKIVNEYDPQEEFIVINIVSHKRIAISRDALRILT